MATRRTKKQEGTASADDFVLIKGGKVWVCVPRDGFALNRELDDFLAMVARMFPMGWRNGWWPRAKDASCPREDALTRAHGALYDLLVELGFAHLDGGVEVTAYSFGRVPPTRRLGNPQFERGLCRAIHRYAVGGLHVENLPGETPAVKWFPDICASGRDQGVRSAANEHLDCAIDWNRCTMLSDCTARNHG